jgi:hypothetical protein
MVLALSRLLSANLPPLKAYKQSTRRKRGDTRIRRRHSSSSVATEDLQYIKLALGFVQDVLDIYENWNGKDTVPLKLQELMKRETRIEPLPSWHSSKK